MKKRILVLALLAFACSANAAQPSKYASMWKEARETLEAKKNGLMRQADAVAKKLKDAEDAVQAVEKAQESHETQAWKEKLRIAKMNLTAAQAANTAFNNQVEPLSTLIDTYSKHESGGDTSLDTMIDQLSAMTDFHDVSLAGLENTAKLGGLERRFDQTMMGAYVREKITAALANTLCDKELCEADSGGGPALRKALEERFNNLYFSPEGLPGRSTGGTKTHK